MAGKKFDRLLVIAKAASRPRKLSGPLAYWLCRCDCGKEVEVSGANLRNKSVLSCGCLQKEITVKNSTKHGQAKRSGWTNEYQMWLAAKQRAKKAGLQFSLRLEDVVIPEVCPVLGTPFMRGRHGKTNPESPSLDRMFPERGYIPSNIRVISHKANTIKQNATTEELDKVLSYSRNSEVFAYA